VKSSSRLLSALIFLCFLSAHLGALAKDKEPKTYPEHGTIVATKTQEQSFTTPVYTDPYGKTQGGVSLTSRRPVYRIETDTKFYEMEGARNKPLALGDTIQFRLEKEWAYVQLGDKEEKLRIVAVELRQNK
jgi:hypothetical protein